MKDIKVVILDIGKVLVEFDWKTYIKNHGYSDEINEELGKIIFDNPMWKGRDRGDKLEEEYKQIFIDKAPHLKKEISEIFENIVDIVEVYPFATEWVKSLKNQGLRVYLLSNYSKTSFEHDISKFKFREYIDGEVISYQINKVKPELEIYQTLLDKYNIIPSEAVFLDDVIENLKGAEAFGIRTIHVTSHERAIEELSKLGIK